MGILILMNCHQSQSLKEEDFKTDNFDSSYQLLMGFPDGTFTLALFINFKEAFSFRGPSFISGKCLSVDVSKVFLGLSAFISDSFSKVHDHITCWGYARCVALE